MSNPNDPLRNGAIFKLKAGALRSPPKIVQFEAPKGSASKTPAKMPTVSNVNSEVRTAFDHIYRQTPTPKVLLGRTAQERTSSLNSPYWPSNLADQLPAPIQTPIVAVPAAQAATNEPPTFPVSSEEPKVSHPEPAVLVQQSVHAETEVALPVDKEAVLESDAEPEPIIKPVKRSTDVSVLKSPNLAKKARIEEPVVPVKVAVSAVASVRSSSASTSNSRTGTNASSKSRTGSQSRSRTGGADSLLLLVAGTGAAGSSVSSSSSSAGSSSSRLSGASSSASCSSSSSSNSAAVQRSSSAGPSRGASRTQASAPASALVSSVPARATSKPKERATASKTEREISTPTTTQAQNKAPKAAPAQDAEEIIQEVAADKAEVVAQSRRPVRKSLVPAAPAPAPAPESDSEPLAEVPAKRTVAASRRVSTSRAVKRKIGSGGESEHSESDISPPPVKTRTAPRRASRGQSKPVETQSSDEEEPKAKQEENEVEEEEEEEVTVTRSGRKSIPKRVIPLAEDAMQSEKQQLKANRARRTSAAPAPAPEPASAPAPAPARATSRSRKSVGSAAGPAAAAANRGAKAAKSSIWSGSEMQALYKVQGLVDISAPDFWELVSEGLADVNLHRTAEECQQRWFASVAEAAVRKKNKEEKTREQNAANTATAPTSSSSKNEEDAPAKAKRLGKGALKKLAQESSKATRDDDIFDSDAMRSYWTEQPAIDDDLLEDLQLFDPTYQAAAAAATSGSSSSSAHAYSAGGGNKRKSMSGEESDQELEFGGSHVHKLHYRPPSKLFAGAQASKAETSTKSAPNKLVNAKTGKVNSTLITKQVNAAVQGARNTARGGRGAAQSDSSEEESSDLDSEDEEDDT